MSMSLEIERTKDTMDVLKNVMIQRHQIVIFNICIGIDFMKKITFYNIFSIETLVFSNLISD